MTPMILAAPPVPETSVVGAAATSRNTLGSNGTGASAGADFAGLVEALMAGVLPSAVATGDAESSVAPASEEQADEESGEDALLADGNSLPTDGMALPVGVVLPQPSADATVTGGAGPSAGAAVDGRLVLVGSAKPLTASQSPVVEFALKEAAQGEADAEGEGKSSMVDLLSRRGAGNKEAAGDAQMPTELAKPLAALSKEGGEGRPAAVGFSAVEALVRGAQAENAGGRSDNGSAQLTSAQLTSALAPAAPAGPISTPASSAATVAMAMSPREPAWTEAFGRNLAELAIKGAREVSFHVDPPELGPIEVSLRMEQQRVDINMSASHPVTRDVLQQSLPQLRELFAAGGLQLGGANIEARDQGGRDPSQQGQPGSGRQGEAVARLPAELDQQVASLNSQYLLDFYA